MSLSAGRQWIATHGLASGRAGAPGGYRSPFLLEIAHSGTFSKYVATGTLTANAPGNQTVSCSRTASAYCLGNDGLLHLLGANTVRVEPAGLLVEGASTNLCLQSTTIGGTGWTLFNTSSSNPTVTLNSTDVTDPTGANTATKVVYPAVSGSQVSGLFNTGGSSSTLGTGTVGVWARTASGTASIDINVNRAGGGGPNVSTITSTWQRFSFPTDGTSANWFIQPQVNAVAQGTLASQTVYLWGPQIEAIPFATSYIPTTTAAATRDTDIVTVSNPLASLSQPVVTWRAGASAQPLPGATWNTAGSSNIGIFLASGPNSGPNNFRMGIGGGFHTYGGGDVNTVAFNVTGPPGWADPTTGNAITGALLQVSSGNATTTPPSDSQPVAVGQVNPFPGSLSLGYPVGFSTFGTYGHMTNIFVDNT